jgi:hypothetical protein
MRKKIPAETRETSLANDLDLETRIDGEAEAHGKSGSRKLVISRSPSL